MKKIPQQGWKLAASIAILALTFALGYLMGSHGTKAHVEVPGNLSSTDIDHAFGRVKQADLEPIRQDAMANSLNALVAGLEKKVAANPENIDQQLLLAQTYNELDNRSKSLNILRALNKSASQNAQVKITMATVLMKGTDQKELNEALQAFDEAIKLDPGAGKMARMYQEEIRGRLKQTAK